jgi:hypothetical protein
VQANGIDKMAHVDESARKTSLVADHRARVAEACGPSRLDRLAAPRSSLHAQVEIRFSGMPFWQCLDLVLRAQINQGVRLPEQFAIFSAKRQPFQTIVSMSIRASAVCSLLQSGMNLIQDKNPAAYGRQHLAFA